MNMCENYKFLFLAIIFSLFQEVSAYHPDSKAIGFVSIANVNDFNEDSIKNLRLYSDRSMTMTLAASDIKPWIDNLKCKQVSFLCLEKNERVYKIQIDSAKFAFIPNTEDLHYISMEQGLIGLRMKLNSNNMVLELPSLSSSTVSVKDFNLFDIGNVVEIKGELWAYIVPYIQDSHSLKQSIANLSGWTKIKSKGRLLVDIELGNCK